MASYQAASESAIKRAREFMEMNNMDGALKSLSEFIVGKKRFIAQPSVLEKVMVLS
jgi:hypothetical protein